jgi:hypothetical protein
MSHRWSSNAFFFLLPMNCIADIPAQGLGREGLVADGLHLLSIRVKKLYKQDTGSIPGRIVAEQSPDFFLSMPMICIQLVGIFSYKVK